MANKTIVPVSGRESNILFVNSEPGDATRYSYFVYRDGPEIFCFMPCDNTFRYPQRLDYWDVNSIDGPINGLTHLELEKLCKMSDKEQCNPNTLLECIRTIHTLHEE